MKRQICFKKSIMLLPLCLFMPQGLLAESLAKLKYDSTTICVPAKYVQGINPFKQWLGSIISDMDTSDGSELIYLPPELIKKSVPMYTISHINEHNVDYRHDIYGLATGVSNVAVYALANETWNVYKLKKSPLVTKDDGTGFYRVFPWGFKSFSWYLVSSPPPKEPSGNAPNDWYIGMCDIDKCQQYVVYKDVYYEYHIDMVDFHLRDEVKSALIALLVSWERNCK